MSRAQRLLDLIQALRRHRFPVSGQKLADEMGVSLRTLYRDIQTLQSQGAHIEGEAGVGYVLRPGYMLPPLMFSDEEIEALALGTRWVAARTDTRLANAATNALAKISAVLPQELREQLDATSLLIGPGPEGLKSDIDLSNVRMAIRDQAKLEISYRDEKGATTQRTVWPFALAFFEQVRVVVAWCELRSDFRHFRIDRIAEMKMTPARYMRRRQALLKEWRGQQNISE